MARSSRAFGLGVWMNGLPVGRWTVDSQGEHRFQYALVWLNSPYGRPISLSLPLSEVTLRGPQVSHYFENLLPDNPEIRRRIQRRFQARSLAPIHLLAEVGRDCVGALQLLPEDRAPENVHDIEAEPLSSEQVARLLAEVTTSASADSEDFRISLAGAQEKTALLFRDGRWWKPKGATPTTHILKLPIGRAALHAVDLSESVENEWLCSQILQAYGLPVAHADVESFGDQKVLVVERFDRKPAPDGTWIMRLPQEDMCQALGVGPEKKYESDGGPGIRQILELLLGARNPEADRQHFFTAQVVFWLLAAIDGHAKNFSLFLEAEGRYRLTPFYDVLSAHPVLGSKPGQYPPQKIKMAMALQGTENRHYHWQSLSRRHLLETARVYGLSQGEALVDGVLEATPSVIETVTARLYHGFPETVAGPILEGLERGADRLAGSGTR